MKNNLSYYRHEVTAHNHWKFKLLRKKYRWEGEGKFWALNNEIAASENCTLNLNDEGRKMSLIVDLDFTPDEFDAYIQYLTDTCRLITQIDGRIQTQITQENLGEVQEDRKRKREWAQRHKDVDKTTNGGLSDNEKNKIDAEKNALDVQTEQSKVKKSKVNNRDSTSSESSTDTTSFSPEADASEAQAIEEYKKIASDSEALKNFIRERRPAFIAPYAKCWNNFAAANGFPKVEKITEERKRKIKTRLKEKAFDFVAIMQKVEASNFDLTQNWLTFDWVLESEKHYVKILEGNYDLKNKSPADAPKKTVLSEYDAAIQRKLKNAS